MFQRNDHFVQQVIPFAYGYGLGSVPDFIRLCCRPSSVFGRTGDNRPRSG